MCQHDENTGVGEITCGSRAIGEGRVGAHVIEPGMAKGCACSDEGPFAWPRPSVVWEDKVGDLSVDRAGGNRKAGSTGHKGYDAARYRRGLLTKDVQRCI